MCVDALWKLSKAMANECNDGNDRRAHETVALSADDKCVAGRVGSCTSPQFITTKPLKSLVRAGEVVGK